MVFRVPASGSQVGWMLAKAAWMVVSANGLPVSSPIAAFRSVCAFVGSASIASVSVTSPLISASTVSG